ncbi:MAG TPA: hypothetical protein VHD35_14425 [Chitinophagaceae bacterium]|nr:hypothetical protein [Chitinophagaceae bacterium]
MKKMFTLAAALGIFAIAQAQPDYRNNRQTDQRSYPTNNAVYYNAAYTDNLRRDGDDNFSFDKQRMIDRINHEYNEKIERVEHNFFLSWREKQMRISMLQDQRDQEIRMVYVRYHDRDDHFGDRDRRDRW